MQRLHVHVAVSDLDRSIAFYKTLFNAEPTVLKPDYAKWMLDDPRVNFALSRRGAASGIDHLGIQVDSDGELGDVAARLSEAGAEISEQKQAACCYARSNKAWVEDPDGLSWETFHTTDAVTTYGEDTAAKAVAKTPPAAAAEPPRCGAAVGHTACC